MDLKALSQQFLEARSSLEAYALAVIQDHDLAEDLVQETYIKMAEAFESGEEIRDLGSWCRGVVRNLSLKRWRQIRQRKEILAPDLLQLVDIAFEEAESKAHETHRRQALAECVEQLPPTSKQILEMKYAEGHAVSRIAEKFRKTQAAVFKILSRLRQGLLECVRARLAEGIG